MKTGQNIQWFIQHFLHQQNINTSVFMYISLILKELFPFMKLIMQFDRTTSEEVISLYENRPTL